MAEIDTALSQKPAVIEFGATWCSSCVAQKPVLESLAGQYSNVAFMYVDVDKSKALTSAFYVSGIPQLAIIVKKNSDGSYVYIGADGKTTTDRARSRIVGFKDANTLKPLINSALAAR